MGFDDEIQKNNNNCRVLESPTQKVLSFRSRPYFMNPELSARKPYNSQVRRLHKDGKVFQHHTKRALLVYDSDS